MPIPAPVARVSAPPRPLFAVLRAALRDYATGAGDAALLWPRWLVLRGVGLVFVLIFAGILDEGPALVGPGGIASISGFLAQLTQVLPHRLEAFARAPSLFWLGAGAGAIAAVSWAGLLAALALVLNFSPRLALFVCWLCLLSFVTTWQLFSSTQVDRLMLETALLCLPFAPAGFRPGLGARSAPRPLAVFMVRWLLFRVMFESGALKLLAGDPRWLDGTALDALYETSPFPTFLGYLDHQLPHAWHVAEFALTFAAELVAPVLAFVGGRRGRWFAFLAWTAFQAGIQLTNNFGWLNVASLALGLLLLDDVMLAAAARRCRLDKLAALLAPRPPPAPPSSGAWARHGLRVALGAHFVVSLLIFLNLARAAGRDEPPELPAPVKLAANFHSANAYTLYAVLLPRRFAVEFEGSNDGGETWRAYPFRYQPQREEQISPFLAPWYARFEATLQVQANTATPSKLFEAVAAHLLARTPAVLRLFRADPFADRPPTMIRLRGYRLSFVDFAAHRATGRYWRKQFEDDYLPLMFVNERGAITAVASELDVLRTRALHGSRDAQAQFGALLAYGDGVPKNPAEATRWFRLAADQGHPQAQFFLGLSYATGDGVPRDLVAAAKYYRLAAEQGDARAQTNLGFMHARGEGLPADEMEALVWFSLAARSGNPDAAKISSALERRLGPVRAAAASRRAEIIFSAITARRRGP